MQALPNDTMINNLNNQAWGQRYVNRDESMRLAIKAKEKAVTDHDQLNLTYARLTIAQLSFWKIAEGDHLKEAIESLHQFEKINDPLGISRAHCICASMYDQYGQYEKAMHHAQHAVKLSRQVVDKENKSDCYTVLGQIYSRTHDYSQAIKALRIGLETRKQLKDLKAVASSLNLIGRNLVLSKNYLEAEEYYKESLLLREQINDVQGIPWTYLGLA
ncbi:MAG: tetratricopeptide repeat protein, partial [Bacteroidetes bacterium]|nr:tetratricopeptide repeat protein [Bacteroidota bacterium]